MKYFIDTEFIERPGTIDLISLGIVSEDNRKLYLVNRQCNVRLASDWVVKNVLEKMPEYEEGRLFNVGATADMKSIKLKVLSFVSGDGSPQFWGYYADYDWVVFCWIFGTMMDLPANFPMYCRDLKQLIDEKGNPTIPFKPDGEHNALSDAAWNKRVYDWISTFRGEEEE